MFQNPAGGRFRAACAAFRRPAARARLLVRVRLAREVASTDVVDVAEANDTDGEDACSGGVARARGAGSTPRYVDWDKAVRTELSDGDGGAVRRSIFHIWWQ